MLRKAWHVASEEDGTDEKSYLANVALTTTSTVVVGCTMAARKPRQNGRRIAHHRGSASRRSGKSTPSKPSASETFRKQAARDRRVNAKPARVHKDGKVAENAKSASTLEVKQDNRPAEKVVEIDVREGASALPYA
jgi:hypothetical protein